MERVNRILHNTLYIDHIKRIEELEIDRIYCHHDISHFVDVARIAMILAAEESILDENLNKSVIYAAALLHDIGRDVQYLEGTEHEIASSMIAPEILKQAGYNENEIELITEAILEHGNEHVKQRKDLTGIIYRGDKLSRRCYACTAANTCHKAEEKRNMNIVY